MSGLKLNNSMKNNEFRLKTLTSLASDGQSVTLRAYRYSFSNKIFFKLEVPVFRGNYREAGSKISAHMSVLEPYFKERFDICGAAPRGFNNKKREPRPLRHRPQTYLRFHGPELCS